MINEAFESLEEVNCSEKLVRCAVVMSLHG